MPNYFVVEPQCLSQRTMSTSPSTLSPRLVFAHYGQHPLLADKK